jgi:hypothetical protein
MSAYISKEELKALREIDLYTYLEQAEPGELVKVSGRMFTTKQHPSVRIENGKWYRHSAKTGDYSAIEYLVQVRDMEFLDAAWTVKNSFGTEGITVPVKTYTADSETKSKRLVLPPKDRAGNSKARAYLHGRGLSDVVTDKFIKEGHLYQGYKAGMAGAPPGPCLVFVGKDKDGSPRHASIRFIDREEYAKQDAKGSDKKYSLFVKGGKETQLCVFESPVDLMSGMDYLNSFLGKSMSGMPHMLSLSGVGGGAAEGKGSSNSALSRVLSENPGIKKVMLCLDNDPAGRAAISRLGSQLEMAGIRHSVFSAYPDGVKDMNEYLLHERRRTVKKIELAPKTETKALSPGPFKAEEREHECEI